MSTPLCDFTLDRTWPYFVPWHAILHCREAMRFEECEGVMLERLSILAVTGGSVFDALRKWYVHWRLNKVAVSVVQPRK